jgi:PAS domain S-box-containing protein
MLMKKRIRFIWKLISVFIVLLVIVLVASGYVNYWIDEHYALASARKVSRTYSETITSNLCNPTAAGERADIGALVRVLVDNNPVCRNIRLISHQDGKVVASRDAAPTAEALTPESGSCSICHALEDTEERLAVRLHDEILERAEGERFVSVTTPVFNENGCRNADCHAHSDAPPVLGVIEAEFTLAGASALFSPGNLRTYVAITAVVLLSCAAAWLLVGRFLNKPLRGLIDGMNNLAERRFDFRLDEDRKDEFGSLAASFNDMASMLDASMTELTKTRDYLRGILESSADIIITVNPSGKIQTINMGAEKALGYPREEVLGKPIETLLADPRDRDVVAEKLEHEDNVVNYETRFRTRDGEAVDVLFTLSRLRNPSGALIGTIGIGKDITDEKRLQKELIQSQRLAAVGQVFTGIQHSMKNMLNACKGGAFMVKTALTKDDREMLEEGWGMVQEGISRMTDMSMNMLKYVKDWKPNLEKVDLTPTLQDIHRVVKQTAKDKGVKLRLNLTPELPAVVCDAKMIHEAVMDIVSNALDACVWKEYEESEEPEILISAYPGSDGQETILEIRDNGCGMTEKVKANIFTPFFSTKSRAGTGLGLAITTRIIGVHGGRIDVESRPNQGAVFRIVLPLDGIGRNKETIDGKKGSGG